MFPWSVCSETSMLLSTSVRNSTVTLYCFHAASPFNEETDWETNELLSCSAQIQLFCLLGNNFRLMWHRTQSHLACCYFNTANCIKGLSNPSCLCTITHGCVTARDRLQYKNPVSRNLFTCAPYLLFLWMDNNWFILAVKVWLGNSGVARRTARSRVKNSGVTGLRGLNSHRTESSEIRWWTYSSQRTEASEIASLLKTFTPVQPEYNVQLSFAWLLLNGNSIHWRWQRWKLVLFGKVWPSKTKTEEVHVLCTERAKSPISLQDDGGLSSSPVCGECSNRLIACTTLRIVFCNPLGRGDRQIGKEHFQFCSETVWWEIDWMVSLDSNTRKHRIHSAVLARNIDQSSWNFKHYSAKSTISRWNNL